MWTQEDKDLLERAQQGDRQAFGDLFEKCRKALTGKFRGYRLTGSDAEDIVQRTSVKALEKIHTCMPQDGSFCSWLGTIARNEAATLWRERPERIGRNALRLDDENNVNSEKYMDVAIRDTEDAVDPKLRRLAFVELTRLVFLCGGYPHEQLAFAYAKAIHGEAGGRGKGKIRANQAEDVAAVYEAKALSQLADEFFTVWETEAEHRLPGEIRDALGPLQARMILTVKYLMKDDAPEKEEGNPPEKTDAWAKRTFVKDTRWLDYYPPGSKRNNEPISDWCYRVREKLRKVLNVKPEKQSDTTHEDMMVVEFSPASCPRCKLRHVPPCSPAPKGSRRPV